MTDFSQTLTRSLSRLVEIVHGSPFRLYGGEFKKNSITYGGEVFRLTSLDLGRSSCLEFYGAVEVSAAFCFTEPLTSHYPKNCGYSVRMHEHSEQDLAYERWETLPAYLRAFTHGLVRGYRGKDCSLSETQLGKDRQELAGETRSLENGHAFGSALRRCRRLWYTNMRAKIREAVKSPGLPKVRNAAKTAVAAEVGLERGSDLDDFFSFEERRVLFSELVDG